jgi:hypothetical protein
MKIWRIEAYIESEDDVSEEDIVSAIYTYFNRGEGFYMDINKNFKLKLVKEVKEEEV